MVPDWRELTTRAKARYRDGESRLPEEPDGRQRQLTRMGNAANAAGLSHLMLGDERGAAEWLARAPDRWRERYSAAPPARWAAPSGAQQARPPAQPCERCTRSRGGPRL